MRDVGRRAFDYRETRDTRPYRPHAVGGALALDPSPGYMFI